MSEALVAGAWFLGQALSFTPSVNAGMKSAMRILKLLDRVPKLYNPPSVPFNVESVSAFFKESMFSWNK